jgi:cytochrome c oxidase subunit II
LPGWHAVRPDEPMSLPWNRAFAARSLLCAALSVLSGLSACDAPPGSGAVSVDAVNVRLVAEDTTWRAAYLTGQQELPTGREVHVPIGADVRLVLTSRTYISDFRLPALGLRDFAAPELPSEFRFRAAQAGRYDVRGDELCGRPHTEKTRGWLVVEDAASFRAWIRKQRGGSQQ